MKDISLAIRSLSQMRFLIKLFKLPNNTLFIFNRSYSPPLTTFPTPQLNKLFTKPYNRMTLHLDEFNGTIFI